MIRLPPDFKEFLQLLNSYEIRYLIIGGYAVGYHGYPRATGDLDIWVAVERQNADKLASALQEFGFDSPEVSPELFLEENKVVRMGLPPVRIELVTTISGVSFEDCYAERIQDSLEDIPVNLISLQRLKENKRASGRYKDLNDLENLP
jgi:hypothetical protein